MPTTGRRTTAAAALSGLVGVVAGMGLSPNAAAAQGGPGFLFKRPAVTFTIRGGYDLPRASSEIFDFTFEELTVERSDLNATAFGADLGIRATERLDVVLGIGYALSETRSEFREWVDTDDLPIEQTTRHSKLPLTVSARYYLRDRGRRLGRFAWVPTKWAPYVGGGGGVLRYEFEQVGDFVDFETLEIFPSRYVSDGTTTTAHVFGGVEISVGGQFVFTAEGRYSWSEEPMSRDFVGFDDIDLAGLQLSVGVGARL